MVDEVEITHDYKVAPEGHTTYTYKAGTKVSGRVAELAVRDGYAKKPRKKTPGPRNTKPDEPEHEG